MVRKLTFKSSPAHCLAYASQPLTEKLPAPDRKGEATLRQALDQCPAARAVILGTPGHIGAEHVGDQQVGFDPVMSATPIPVTTNAPNVRLQSETGTAAMDRIGPELATPGELELAGANAAPIATLGLEARSEKTANLR